MITFKRGEQRKSVTLGYSWQLFFFGPIAMTVNKEYKYAIIFFIIEALIIRDPNLCLLFNVPSMLFAFIYARLRVNKLRKDGWYPATRADGTHMRKFGYNPRNFDNPDDDLFVN